MPRKALWFLTWVLRWVEFQGNFTPTRGFPVAPPNTSTPPDDRVLSRAGGHLRCYTLGRQLKNLLWTILVRTDWRYQKQKPLHILPIARQAAKEAFHCHFAQQFLKTDIFKDCYQRQHWGNVKAEPGFSSPPPIPQALLPAVYLAERHCTASSNIATRVFLNMINLLMIQISKQHVSSYGWFMKCQRSFSHQW